MGDIFTKALQANYEYVFVKVYLTRLAYKYDETLPPEKRHTFIYSLTIKNFSEKTITLIGRKWILNNSDGSVEVIEGDGIIGQTPTLAPDAEFSYSSYHITDQSAKARGAFYGIDQKGAFICAEVLEFDMILP